MKFRKIVLAKGNRLRQNDGRMSEPQEFQTEVTVYFGPFCADSREIPVTVHYYYIPGDPGCRTMRNGDPGWPPTAPEVEIIGIADRSGKAVFLPDARDYENLIERILEESEAVA